MPSRIQSRQAVAERIGAILAGEVIKANARLVPVADGTPITFARQAVELPLRVPTAEEMARAQERWPFEMHSMDAIGLVETALNVLTAARRDDSPS